MPIGRLEEVGKLTVDGNGDRLGEGEVVGTNERRDEAELVDEPVVVGDALGGLSVDELDVKVVDVGHSLDGDGAGVTLGSVLVRLTIGRFMIHTAARQKRWGAFLRAARTG